MSKLEYKPIAIQNECFGGRIGTDSKEQTVIIKLMAEGKSYPYYKTDAITFPDGESLVKWIEETKVVILPEEEFKKLK